MAAAVRSPFLIAVQAWAASWTVMAKRRENRLMTMDKMSMG
jgi:hypothetical protein